MSVIVKGMNMPDGCWNCPVRFSYEKPSLILREVPFRCAVRNGKKIKVNKNTGFDNNCPLEPYREDGAE